MWTWLRNYNADLVRRGTASGDAARYGETLRIALPWLIPLVGMVVVGLVADALPAPYAWRVTIFAVLLLGLPALLGMVYATTTYLIAGFRADRNRRRTLPKSPPG